MLARNYRKGVALSTQEYHSEKEKDEAVAEYYSKTHGLLHRFLAYRDLPLLLNQYVCGVNALDYGTGTGYSAGVLKELGFDVVAVDISEKMLDEARAQYADIPFYLVTNGIIPLKDGSCDLIFSSFVLLELSTEEKLLEYLNEARRVMKEDGVFIAITGSELMHSPIKNWLLFQTNYPENIAPESGSLVKLNLRELNMEFTDFFWREKDYSDCFEKAGFRLVEQHYPIGKATDPYTWRDEVSFSPYVMFVAKAK